MQSEPGDIPPEIDAFLPLLLVQVVEPFTDRVLDLAVRGTVITLMSIETVDGLTLGPLKLIHVLIIKLAAIADLADYIVQSGSDFGIAR